MAGVLRPLPEAWDLDKGLAAVFLAPGPRQVGRSKAPATVRTGLLVGGPGCDARVFPRAGGSGSRYCARLCRGGPFFMRLLDLIQDAPVVGRGCFFISLGLLRTAVSPPSRSTARKGEGFEVLASNFLTLRPLTLRPLTGRSGAAVGLDLAVADPGRRPLPRPGPFPLARLVARTLFRVVPVCNRIRNMEAHIAEGPGRG